MIMLKDNHIDYNGSITNAVKMTRLPQKNKLKLKVEVETRNLAEVKKLQKNSLEKELIELC